MQRPWARRKRSDDPQRLPSLAPLKQAAYRRFVFSQVFNSLCLWTHRTAQVWLTVVVTDGDPFSVGLVTALQFLPMMFSAFLGGLGDRWNKRRVLLISQVIAVLGSLVLAFLAVADAATVPVLGLMAVVLGFTAAVDAPVRLAFPREIVEQQLLKSAIGLNGLVFQGSRVIGPAVAGLVIARWNEGVGFLVGAGAGMAALAVLSLVHPTPASVLGEDSDGRWRTTLSTIRYEPALLSPLIGAFVVGACLANLQVALPLIVDRMPTAGASDFGLLVAIIGVGGACGALTAAVVRRGQSLAWLNVFLIVYALGTLTIAAMPTVLLLAATIFVTSLVMQLYNTNAITILQEASPTGQHGRVMGVYVVAFFVWAGFGTPLFGLAADITGPRQMLALSSLVCVVLGALLWLRHRAARPVSPGPVVPG